MFGFGSKSLEKNKKYLIEGHNVIFQLGDVDFTFDQFSFKLGDKLMISVKDEVAMNVSQLSEVIDGMKEIDVNPMGNEVVNFTIILKPHIFRQIRDELVKQENPEELFEYEVDQSQPLKQLKNYQLSTYAVH